MKKKEMNLENQSLENREMMFVKGGGKKRSAFVVSGRGTYTDLDEIVDEDPYTEPVDTIIGG